MTRCPHGGRCTIREWVEAPGVRYQPVDGELELLLGLRLVPAPGHTRGMQVVVVERAGRLVASAATWRVASASSTSRAPRASCAVRALEPELVWLAHEHEPWRPRTM
jgi:N-acyl homoserine lactone hydrolase